MNPEQELRDLGLRPGKGQNFLKSEHIIEALVEAGEIDGEKTLEIGGGLGAITEKLQGKTDELTVVEMDSGLAKYLKKEFPSVNVEEGDILERDLSEFERCVSNIPFEISSDIIEMLGENQIQSSLIVQDALADKIVLDPGDPDYGYFSMIVNYYFVPVKLRTVKAYNFHPAPEVDTAIIKLYPNKDRYDIDDEENFLYVSKALFTHKRKKLRNALVDSRNILGLEKDQLKEVRDDAPHSEKRVIELDVRKMAEVAEWFKANLC